MMPPPRSNASLEAALDQVPVGGDAFAVRLGLLRELRAEIQDLQVVLQAVRKGKTSIKAFGDYVAKTKADIADLMEKIVAAELAVRAAPLPKKKSAAAGDTDNLRHWSTWEQMQICPLLVDPPAITKPRPSSTTSTRSTTRFARWSSSSGPKPSPPA
jgi:hypothetical protein